ncbi:unnamed protein product [Closterium sp. Naga37s-1]|nr:unnamed protein product [Closterium sp. Naga37s-1]
MPLTLYPFSSPSLPTPPLPPPPLPPLRSFTPFTPRSPLPLPLPFPSPHIPRLPATGSGTECEVPAVMCADTDTFFCGNGAQCVEIVQGEQYSSGPAACVPDSGLETPIARSPSLTVRCEENQSMCDSQGRAEMEGWEEKTGEKGGKLPYHQQASPYGSQAEEEDQSVSTSHSRPCPSCPRPSCPCPFCPSPSCPSPSHLFSVCISISHCPLMSLLYTNSLPLPLFRSLFFNPLHFSLTPVVRACAGRLWCASGAVLSLLALHPSILLQSPPFLLPSPQWYVPVLGAFGALVMLSILGVWIYICYAHQAMSSFSHIADQVGH